MGGVFSTIVVLELVLKKHQELLEDDYEGF